ncbi:hypothetical protein [Streptomyces sp. 7N604]|uniref:hypothetical protein n=1 Tax=Streptomyces sp. 7N604 TaxID=3457415 RepID=UPI003FCFFE86
MTGPTRFSAGAPGAPDAPGARDEVAALASAAVVVTEDDFGELPPGDGDVSGRGVNGQLLTM